MCLLGVYCDMMGTAMQKGSSRDLGVKRVHEPAEGTCRVHDAPSSYSWVS